MQKTIINISHPRDHHWVGDGFRVSQYIPGYGKAMSDEDSPFLMLDYMPPYRIEPKDGDHRPGVGYHPHRGFETVTIVYAGEIEHSDTAGNGGVIGPDEIQWMTAGRGLLHNEFFTSEFSHTGGIASFVQLWVDLPKEYKMTPPRYQALTKESIPAVLFTGGKVRVIAGELKMKDEKGIIHEQKGIAETFSPVELYDVRFDSVDSPLIKGVRGISFYFPEGYTAKILVVEGEIEISGKTIGSSDMVTFSLRGSEISLVGSSDAKILIMAGSPLGQKVVNYGPFVMNTQEEIMEAFADLRAGKMGRIL